MQNKVSTDGSYIINNFSKKITFFFLENKYRTRVIIARSRSETALKYKPRILGLKNEEFPFLVNKLSVI